MTDQDAQIDPVEPPVPMTADGSTSDTSDDVAAQDNEPAVDSFEEGGARIEVASTTPGGLVVDIDGFEGPLDVLLALARTQKVDLAKLASLPLAEQYLEFVDEARRLDRDLAADYLVMAAWLAFLKSKLLLPQWDCSRERRLEWLT